MTMYAYFDLAALFTKHPGTPNANPGYLMEVILSVLLLGLGYWYYRVTSSEYSGIPPWPSTPMPVVGHLHLLTDKSIFAKWRGSFGDIYSLKLGPKLAVVLNGYSVVKEAFVKRADDFSDRPLFFFDRPEILDEKDHGVVFSNGPLWKEQRTRCISTLRKLGMGKNDLADRILEEIECLLESLDKLGSNPADIRTDVTKSVSNVACVILLGARFEYTDAVFKEMLDLLDYNVHTVGGIGTALINFWPWLYSVPGDIFGVKKMMENTRVIRDILVQHYKSNRGDEDDDSADNYIAAYLKEQKRKEEKGEATVMSDKNMRRVLNDLFAGSTETTSVTLNWCLAYLMKHPDVQEKAFKEIEDAVGTNRLPSMHDKTQLKYVNAIIMETQRFGNVSPFSISHLCPREIEFRNYRIPAGTEVMFDMGSVFFDKSVWGEDAHTFKPERFIDEDGNLISREEFVPFSMGRRSCPGESLAKMTMFLYMAALLQRYRIAEPNPDQPSEVSPINGGLAIPPGPFQVLLVPRVEIS